MDILLCFFIKFFRTTQVTKLITEVQVFVQISKEKRGLYLIQKQLSGGVLKKSCSENMRQIYRRTPISKCNFASAWVFSCKFAAYFQNTFFQNTCGWLLKFQFIDDLYISHYQEIFLKFQVVFFIFMILKCLQVWD